MNRLQKQMILKRLEEMYPEAKAELVFSNPYEMMVATILSAQCTDKQVNKVTPAVFARYPDPTSMAEALEEDLYPMVKSCGFRTKAANIIAACRIIRDEYGGKVPDTMEDLIRLPGSAGKRPTWFCSMHSGFRPSRWIPMCSGSATGWVSVKRIQWKRQKDR